MNRETERPIIISEGLDNEIEELCQAQILAKAMVKESPRDSCDYRLFKVQLMRIEKRLAELGIDNIIEEESDIEEDEYCLRRSLPR